MNAWSDFEATIAGVFKLKGFHVLQDSIVAGRQHDMLVTSPEESILPILIECKYHDPSLGHKVTVTEVDNFAARVIRLRTSGDISTGYLITNTDFTARAKGAFASRPEEKFIFLRTLSELRRQLINFTPYLQRLVDGYKKGDLHQQYEPLYIIEPKNSICTDVLHEFIRDPEARLALLMGDYGTGKTTAVRTLCYQMAQALLSDNSDERVPIFVPLKWYVQAGSVLAILQRFMDEEGFRHYSLDTLLSMHSSGHLVLILDGLDEMARRSTEQSRDEALRDIADLCTEHTKVILTGRAGYFPNDEELQRPLESLGVTGASERIRRITPQAKLPTQVYLSSYQLAPLNKSQMRGFLRRRFTARSVDDPAESAEVVIRAVESTYNLEDLATRPILLEMIAETIGECSIDPVRNPAELYSMYINTWLQIDADKGAFRRLISPEDRLDFSMALAWTFLDSGIDSIHWAELQPIVGDFFELEESDDVDHFSGDIRTCSFLTRDEYGYYSFAHLSFQEYFCARCIAEQQRGFKQIVGNLDGNIDDIYEILPATLDFLADMIGVPVSPIFWMCVEEALANCLGLVGRDEVEVTDDVITLVSDLAGGEHRISEIPSLVDSYKAAYQDLSNMHAVLADCLRGDENVFALGELLSTRRHRGP